MGSKCRNKDQVGLRPGSHNEHCLMKIFEVIETNMASTFTRSQSREQRTYLCDFTSSLYRMIQMILVSRLVLYLVRQHYDKDERKRDF